MLPFANKESSIWEKTFVQLYNIIFIYSKQKLYILRRKKKSLNLYTWFPPFWPLKRIHDTSLFGYFWRTLNVFDHSRLSPLSKDQTLAQEVVWKMSGLRNLWIKFWVARKIEEESKGFMLPSSGFLPFLDGFHDNDVDEDRCTQCVWQIRRFPEPSGPELSSLASPRSRQ